MLCIDLNTFKYLKKCTIQYGTVEFSQCSHALKRLVQASHSITRPYFIRSSVINASFRFSQPHRNAAFLWILGALMAQPRPTCSYRKQAVCSQPKCYKRTGMQQRNICQSRDAATRPQRMRNYSTAVRCVSRIYVEHSLLSGLVVFLR